MKKIFLIILLIGFTTGLHAQKNKNSNKAKRAMAQVDYVAKKMNLNDSQKAFVLQALTEKMERTANQTKGKQLTKEAKKAINKESNRLMTEQLSTKFSKSEVKQIRTLLREYQKQHKK